MWLGDLLQAWLPDVGVNTTRTDGYALDTPLLLGPFIPNMPNRIAVATPLPGADMTVDDAFDQPGFQLFVRGGRNDMDGADAGRRAAEYDRNILFGDSFNRVVRSPTGTRIAYLSRVTRVGGGPATTGPWDTGQRVEITCSYLLHLAF